MYDIDASYIVGCKNDGHSRSRPQQYSEMFFTCSMQVAPELPLVVTTVAFLHNMVLHCALEVRCMNREPIGRPYQSESGVGATDAACGDRSHTQTTLWP